METSSRAKFFFLELGILAALYTTVISFISFLFDIINYAFPDPLAYSYDPYSTGIRMSISVLIVTFPVLVYLTHVAHRIIKRDPEAKNSAIRRWLAYVTIFLASLAIVIDLITLINTFLSGEIGERFVYKVLAVLLVAGIVFWYTMRDLRGAYIARPNLLRIFTIIISVLVVASLVCGFMFIGSPTSQRLLREDNDRASDLSSLQWGIVDYYQRTGDMPGSIQDLVDPLYGPEHAKDMYTDPVTGEYYEYTPLASTDMKKIPFEICATFALASADNEGRGEYYGYGGGYAYDMSYPAREPGLDQNFKHIEGRNCFERSIDVERYPVYDRGEI